MVDVVVIHGDGVGNEVVPAARCVLEETDVPLNFRRAVMGEAAIDETGEPLPDETVESVKAADAALKGPVTTPVGSGFRSVNVALRKRCDCFANVRPACFMDGVSSRMDDPSAIDMVVVRENLEDLYAGIEFKEGTDSAASFRNFLSENGHETPSDSGYSVKPISRRGSERVIRYAFEYAEEHDREKVTVVDKSNIMKFTDGLFKEVGEQVASEFDVAYEHLLVDNMAQQLVLRPEDFDVIVTQNIYGDILSDLTAGLVGGLGLAYSANIGDTNAIFESVHGTAPDIAGEAKANPAALVMSAAMLLEHTGYPDEAGRVFEAVETVVGSGEVVTPDLGGEASTREMTDAIIEAL